MMATSKPVQYVNLVDSLIALIDTHQSIHDTIRGHVQDHTDSVAAKRRELGLKHAAKKLLEGDATK